MLHRLSQLLGFGSQAERVLVGTHHKCGTVWMKDIFSAVCDRLSLVFYIGEQRHLPRRYDVFFQDHSRFRFSSLAGAHRGLHLIRDPRDLIISGVFYHERCTSERWLTDPAPQFHGRSYQQTLAGLPSLEEKIRFEMLHCSGSTIRDMLAWNYGRPTFYEARYEDLIEDVELRRFRDIFTFLGYPEDQMDELLQIAFEGSLFSGRVNAPPGHVRSGQPRQWQSYFNKPLYRQFLEHFGDALVRLGYEQNDQWCP
jgi:hypothetical protein